ncbi:hypothetical protein V8C34DRAFT_316365 [Trichoderma compactum]
MAHNCPATNKKNIGIIGAGVNAAQAIGFFSKHGMSVTTGACPTVGIAGGFGLGGGHGPLAPTHSLMVDQAVEFDVVTTDGVFRTINECNEPDLFWAMRGGGGSSFAVLVNYKFQLHPQVRWASWRIENQVEPRQSLYYRKCCSEGDPNPCIQRTTHVVQESCYRPYQVFDSQPEFYAAEAEVIAAGSVIDALVSALLGGMEAARQQLEEELAAGVAFFILKTGAINTPDTEQATSINPAWRKTLWHVIIIASWPPGAPKEASSKITAGTRDVLDVIKGPLSVQAAYFNEADVTEPGWKNVFFGEP